MAGTVHMGCTRATGCKALRGSKGAHLSSKLTACQTMFGNCSRRWGSMLLCQHDVLNVRALSPQQASRLAYYSGGAHGAAWCPAEVLAVPLRQLRHLLALQEIGDLQAMQTWAPQPVDHRCMRSHMHLLMAAPHSTEFGLLQGHSVAARGRDAVRFMHEAPRAYATGRHLISRRTGHVLIGVNVRAHSRRSKRCVHRLAGPTRRLAAMWPNESYPGCSSSS